MNKEILTLYETYFQSADNNFRIFVDELASHHCSFCLPEKAVKIKHCKTDMIKIILEYLNHLKLMSYPWKKLKYFFKSIEITGFLTENCLGKWTMKKWLEKDTYILCRY